MAESIFDKTFKPADIEKLTSILNSCQVSLQHISDIREQMKEMVKEAADDLDLKPSDINKAASALYKQNISEKRSQQDQLEELLAIAGFDISGPMDA